MRSWDQGLKVLCVWAVGFGVKGLEYFGLLGSGLRV